MLRVAGSVVCSLVLAAGASADRFTIIALPDTQNYVNSSSNAPLFTQQTQWIVDRISGGNPDNIVFVTHLGDVVSTGSNLTQHNRADASLSVLDGGLPESVIPWSVLPGNHDYDSTGNKGTGTTTTWASSGRADSRARAGSAVAIHRATTRTSSSRARGRPTCTSRSSGSRR